MSNPSDHLDRLDRVLRSFLERAGKPADYTRETQLFAEDGLGLDSLDTAELSAVLEDEFGTDPFSAGDEMPQTVGAIADYYTSAQV